MFSNLFKRIITSLILITILLIGLYYSDLSWRALLAIFLIISFYEFYNLLNKIQTNKFFIIISLLLTSIYLYVFYLILVRVKINFGEEAILVLLLSCFFSDIGGYIIGKLVGGPKLTSLSPNKTISGSIGSIFFCIVGTLIFLFFLDKIDKNQIVFEISVKIYVWLILMSIYCQIGDLLISYLKRKAKVKDTGNILPGHGGVLDRVDGIIFAIPFGIMSYYLLGLSL